MTNSAQADPPSPSTEETLQNGAPSWAESFTPGRLAGLIALFLFALYPGVILGTHSFFFRDFGAFTYPVAFYAHESFWKGEVPLWNPLNNCGVPFLAQWNTSVCYPLSLIYLIFPLPQSLNYFCLGHLVLAGIGMYLLACRWTQNRLAASIAGLVFALNGLMLNNLMWTSNLAALSWQPLLVLWVEQAWRLGGRRQVVIAAFAGAMQMLAGAPEIIVFTWVMLVVLWLGQAWHEDIPSWPTLRRFVIVIMLVIGLSAIQLLPFFDLLSHSERSSAYSTTMADAWPMPVWGWANFFVPNFHCLQGFFGIPVQSNQPWVSSYYLGLATIALAVLAVWRLWRQPEICGLAGITLAGLVLALGEAGYVYAWLKHIVPWIGFARYPIKFVSIPVFTIPLLAACGFNTLYHAAYRDWRRTGRFLIFVTAFVLLTVVWILATARWRLAPVYDWPMTWRDGALRASLFFVTIGAISISVYARAIRLHPLMGLTVLALIGFDLITVGMRVNPTIVAKAFGPLELNMSSPPRYGESRAMVSRQVLSYIDLNSARTKNPLYYYVGLRGALVENCNMPENIPKVDGFCSLHLRYEWGIDGMFYSVYRDVQRGGYAFPTNALPAPLLDFMGVSQISAPDTIFAWQERKTFLPLATAGQRPIFTSDAEMLAKLNSAAFDPRHTVYLPLSARSQVTVTNTSAAKITSQQFGAQSARLTVEAPAAALVVIAQSFYHDWHVYVDGRPVPLLRANHAFQALEIPAGQHEITLRYEDSMFQLGALISVLTLLGCVAGLLQKPGN